jgi:hypothetical protein
VALDYVFQESWLLAQIGDRDQALRRLRQSLESLSTVGNSVLSQVPQAAALCRAYALAATLSADHADPTRGNEWARRRSSLCESPR